MDAPWRIEMLGWLRAVPGTREAGGDRTVARFRTQKTGELLACLAYYRDRSHPREALIERLWPEIDRDAGRNRFKVALASLRCQLEPPDVPRGAVLIADRASVQLNPTACTTDVAQFAAALAAAQAGRSSERMHHLTQAVELYRGELLPGYLSEWVMLERQRLAQAFLHALGQLSALLEQAGDLSGAVRYARQAVAADSLQEETQHELIRLLVAAGQTEAALRQFRELERLLARELGATPAAETRALVQQTERAGAHPRSGSWVSSGSPSPTAAARFAPGSGPPAARVPPARAGTRPGPAPRVPPLSLCSPGPGTREAGGLRGGAPPSPCPPSALPAGTVTFLLIDVGGELLPTGSGAAGAPAAARQRERLHSLFRDHGGREMMATGEVLAIAFTRASAALAAGVAAQRAGVRDEGSGVREGCGEASGITEALSQSRPSPLLTPHPSPLTPASGASLRMALHTGEVAPGEAAHQHPALQHAARLLRAAHPGQILLSEETGGLLRREPSPDVWLVDLGQYRLQEAAAPERLFQARYPEMLPQQFPPPNALSGPLGHLPLQFTRFFGRQDEIARLQELLLPLEPPHARAPMEGVDPTSSGTAAVGRPGRADVWHPGTGEAEGGPASRLVTLTGPGGGGKTRLAQEVAGRLLEAWHGAVWFVPLADVSDPWLIGHKVRDALRLPRAPQWEPLEQVAAFLSRQPTLLLLDNFEHLVSEGATLVQTLLDQVETLTVLVTSRQRLGLAGEQELEVRSLPTPVDGSWLMVDRPTKTTSFGLSTINRVPAERVILSTLARNESVRLFVDRAQAVRPDFQLTSANAAAVAELCARLDGLPLAIELAAARASVLTPQQMLARLRVPGTQDHPLGAVPPAERAGDAGSEQDAGAGPALRAPAHETGGRFELLVSRQKNVAARHHSLRAALDWSYQLLSPELQRFFSALSVFRGGWSLAAAEAVCGDEGALESLAELRGNSLVRSEAPGTGQRVLEEIACADAGGEPLGPGAKRGQGREPAEPAARDQPEAPGEAEMRYRMLETLREYGWEQLSLEARAALERRHAEYCLALAEEAEFRLRGPDQDAWFQRLETEHDNLRAALAWSITCPAPELGLRLGGALGYFWVAQGHLREGREWLTGLLSLPGAHARTPIATKAQTGAGLLAAWLGDLHTARSLLEESLAVQRELGDRPGIAWSLNHLGIVANNEGDSHAARRLHQESLAIRRELGDPWEITWSLNHLGLAAEREGDLETARALHSESLAIGRELGDQRGIAWSLTFLGDVLLRQDEPGMARVYYTESLSTWRRLNHKLGIAWSLRGLGQIAQKEGDLSRARLLLEDSLTLRQELGDQRSLECLEGLAGVASAEGQPKRAARLFAAAARLRDSLGIPLPPHRQREQEDQLAALRATLGDPAFTTAWLAGQVLTRDRAVAEALGR